jgi:hypothetical protein
MRTARACGAIGNAMRAFLIVAHQSVAAPVLLDEVQRRAESAECRFSLLIPEAGPPPAADWTLGRVLPLFERAAGAPVEGIVARGHDVFGAIELTLAERAFDGVIISTLPRRRSDWLRRDLPARVRRLGVPVTVVTPVAEAGARV